MRWCELVDRKLLVEDMNQIEQALTDLETNRQAGTLRAVDPWVWLISLTRAVWHILEYLIRRDHG